MVTARAEVSRRTLEEGFSRLAAEWGCEQVKGVFIGKN
jgi:hypothetical protein